MNLFGGVIRLRSVYLFLIFTISIGLFGAYSQSNPVFPNTQRLVQGTDLQPGAVYIIDDVELSANGTPTNVDAILRIVSFTGATADPLDLPTVESIDITQNVLNRFEPSITYDAPGQAVRWQMEFIVAGSADGATDNDAILSNAVPFPLDSYTLEIIDLDAQEWAEVVVPNSYELAGTGQPETILTVSTGTLVPNSIRFTSANITDPGINVNNTRSIVRINYENVSVVDFTLGRDNNDPNTTRNISVGFLGEVVFGSPVTTTINSPPTVQDNLGNIVDRDQEFDGNILTGSNDPDGNLDPDTIIITDPNDISNFGTINTDLTIPGVGVYSVTNTGSINFDPVSNYTGDASILFRVEDTLGVSSEDGNLQITVLPPGCNAATSGAPDRDGDGISDVCDLDNDNDGILDSVEGCSEVLALTDANLIIDGTTWQNNYLDNVTNEVTEDFEGLSGTVASNTFTGFTLSGGTIAGASFGTSPNSGTNQVALTANNTTTINFTTPVYGFGINFGDLHDSADGPSTFTIAIDGTTVWNSVDNNANSTLQITNTVDSSTLTVGNTLYNFFGYYNVTTPISTVTITVSGSGEDIVYDDISYIPSCTDTDGDGIADALDLDSDNDGIADVKEVGGTDANNDGRADGAPGATGIPSSAGVGVTPSSSDGDSIPDYLDIDSDNDGIPDNIEAQDTFDYIAPSGKGTAMIDADKNGLDDAYQTTGINGIFGLVPVNTDNTDNPDYLDADSDNDGVNDIAENGDTNNALSGNDADGDGLDDNFDDNNDTGTNGFTVNDNHNPPNPSNLGDNDNDFLANGSGGNVDYRDSPNDTDNDGIIDALDIDDDNDGILDVDEGFVGCTGSTITSAVGTVTTADGATGPPMNMDLSAIGVGIGETVTVNNVLARGDIDDSSLNEGFTLNFNSGEFTTGTLLTSGLQCSATLNAIDSPISQTLTVIDLGNGVPGIRIQATTLAGVGGFCEGDSFALEFTVDISCTAAAARDTDGDLVPDYLDLDADNDGIPDNIEAQSTSGYTAPSGNDADNDGLDDAYDATPNGNSNGSGSNGLTPQNTDNADDPDYIDLDSDNDGAFDVVESGSGLANDGAGEVTGAVGTNGLVDAIETGDTDQGYTDVNGEYDETFATVLTDTDGDVNSGGDLDYRDIAGVIDTDNDGFPDTTDLDDDNDGILDTVENNINCSAVPLASSGDIIESGGGNGVANLTTVNDGDFTADNGVIFNAVGEYIILDLGRFIPEGTIIEFTLWTTSNANDRSLRFAELSNTDVNIGGGTNIETVNHTDINLNANTLYNYTLSKISRYIQVDMPTRVASRIEIVEAQIQAHSSCDFDVDGDGIINSLDLDSDNDGITDVIESEGTDTDNNGKADGPVGTSGGFLGVPSSTNNGTGNTPINSDGDSIPDYLDIDADNDGIPDNVEGQTTSGWTAPSGVGTGITDANNNGVDDTYEDGTTIGLTPTNTDGTDNPDYQDTDSDNDGVNDVDENGDNDTFALVDADGDGLVDAFDDNDDSGISGSTVNDNHNPPNAGNLGDEDSDFGTGGDVDYRDVTGVDSDNDGIIDAVDLDDDNDGILDTEEQNCPTTDFVAIGGSFTQGDTNTTDGSQTSGSQTSLYTLNGVNVSFAYEVTNSATWSTQGVSTAGPTAGIDGNYINVQPNNTDFPIGTSYPDDAASIDVALYTFTFSEAVTSIEFKWGGIDNNDRAQFIGQLNGDNVPLTVTNNNLPVGDFTISGQTVNSTAGGANGPSNSVVVSSSGPLNQIIIATGKSVPPTGSGTVTMQFFELTYCTNLDTDGDGIPNYLDLDSDNDGIPDVIESGGTDADRDGRADGAVGTSATTNGIPSSAGLGQTPRNLDSDSIPDYLDIDADNDGIPDNIEGQPSRNYVAPSGVGTGITDANENGVDDNYETGGFVGIDPENTDGTDNPDYIDTNSDNDLIDDIAENGDTDNVLSGNDTDGDGLDDNFEGSNNNDGFDVNDEIDTPNAANLGDEDNDFNSIGDLDYRDAGANGVPMITQIYQFDNERWIEITNVSTTASINPNFINVLLFKDKTGDQTGILPDASFTVGSTLAPGQSVIFRNATNTITNINSSAIDVTNNDLTDIEGANDIVILSNFTDITSWANRFDVVQEFENKTSLVRIDETLVPNSTYTPSEWVVFIDDAIDTFTLSADANAGRHPHDPLVSEIINSDTDANTLLGLHRIDVTTRTGGAWNNGVPDRSRFVIVDEDFNQTTGRLSARKLTINASRKLGVTDNLLVVTNDVVLNGDIRLINSTGATPNSAAQFIQTHTSASLVTGTTGRLLVDQNTTVESVYRYDYMSSPVKETSGSTTFSLANILKDGSNPTDFNSTIGTTIAKDINFIGGLDGSFTASSISLPNFWIYTFETDGITPANWERVGSTGNINNSDGFIFKGPGKAQNYTFMGIPKDGTLTTPVGGFESYLIGNPFASAISVKEFIEDNIDAITGVLYFWQHAGEETVDESTAGHNFSGYIGGYATRTILTGVDAKTANGGAKDDLYEAEASVNVITGTSNVVRYDDDDNEGTPDILVDVIVLDADEEKIDFRGIQSSVDDLIIRYSSTVAKDIEISQFGTETQGRIETLPNTSGDFINLTINVCLEAGRTITLKSLGSGAINIDHIRLFDEDGETKCAPNTDFSGLPFVFQEPAPYIAVGQGFFVSGDSDGGTITFDNSQREYVTEGANSIFFKSSGKGKTSSKNNSITSIDDIPVLKIGMVHEDANFNSLSRQLAITFGPFQSFDYDKGYDAEMFDAGSTDVYWKFPDDNRKFVIAGVQSVSSDLEVPLEIKMGSTGQIAIRVDEMKNFNQEAIYIVDKVTGISYNIVDGAASLTLEQGTYTDRFFLAFEPIQVLSNEDEILNNLTTIFVDNANDNVVVTKTNDITIHKVRLYNLLGKQVGIWNIKEQRAKIDLKIERKLPMGVYVVELQTDKGKLNKKVIIE